MAVKEQQQKYENFPYPPTILPIFIRRKKNRDLSGRSDIALHNNSTVRNEHHDMRLYFLVKLSFFHENQVYKPKFRADLPKVFVHLQPFFVVLIKLVLS